MMAMLRMVGFHLRRFFQVRFFMTLLVTSTVSMFALQWLAHRAAGTNANDPDMWLRAGEVGMWAVCTVSAGIIGYKRFLGTLPYLLLSPRRPIATLMPVVVSGSVVGLGAFPLAAVLASLTGQEVTIEPLRLVLGVLAYWMACVSLCLVIAPVFVLSANAITYEPLMMIPVVLASGVFGYAHPVVEALGQVIPTSHAIAYLSGAEPIRLLWCAGVSALWVVLGMIAAHIALSKATRHGTLEVVA